MNYYECIHLFIVYIHHDISKFDNVAYNFIINRVYLFILPTFLLPIYKRTQSCSTQNNGIVLIIYTFFLPHVRPSVQQKFSMFQIFGVYVTATDKPLHLVLPTVTLWNTSIVTDCIDIDAVSIVKRYECNHTWTRL
jgi:hypothetical protein